MKKSVKSVLVLVCICAAVSILLALANAVTAPIIAESEQKKANAALLEVLPDGGDFELVDISSYTLPSTVSEVYRASNGGYVIKLTTTGYASGMVMMCGISADGTVTGSKIISSAETPSIGGVAAESIASAVVGKDITSIDLVDTVAGATKTTAAYLAAVKDAMNTVVILGGGDVDLRDEEEILKDNLSAALPEADGKFTKHFFVEVVEGIDAIYTADNKSGAVCVIGEQFIAVDANGKVLSDCSEEDAKAVKNAMAAINATTATEIDLSAHSGLPSQLISAKLTEAGNYIIEIKAAGYGITGGNEYHPASGEYIVIRVSLTAQGKIIDCLTVYQNETEGIGSACEDEAFYGQFDGKTEENYDDIDAISGATLTTNGYKKAILRAFESVKIFEEGKNQ
ncbi:MAG: FMN-binding protein [Clostridia bacterium]|nr:FMN-binding protein [Clostridia bacterium]